MSDILSLPYAELLATEVTRRVCIGCGEPYCHECADRKRIASDLAGLRQHGSDDHDSRPECIYCQRDDRWYDYPCRDARRYSDNLRRTAALYAVTLCERHGCERPHTLDW